MKTVAKLNYYFNYCIQINKTRPKEIQNKAKLNRIKFPAFYYQSCSGLKMVLLLRTKKAAPVLLGQVVVLVNF